MNQAKLDAAMTEDKFAAAQVMLYVFSVLQVVVALGAAIGAVPTGAVEVSTMQRVSATTNAVINILAFAAAYVMVAREVIRATLVVVGVTLAIGAAHVGLRTVIPKVIFAVPHDPHNA
jgi:hypothetical protein